jgi:hypothetical protein
MSKNENKYDPITYFENNMTKKYEVYCSDFNDAFINFFFHRIMLQNYLMVITVKSR